jgi:oligopeptide/dipeptide ABC transporter ATP-binding protein
LGPELLVADEPISMLDMSVRAKILELMIELKDNLGLTYIYITHDLASAKFFCDRIAIMYLGRIVEIGNTEEIFADPKHPYTKALLKAIPEPDPSISVPRDLPRGEIPDAAEPPLGCSFHPRCPVAVANCGWESRDLRVRLEERWLAVGPAEYDRERQLFTGLDALDTPTQRVSLRPSRSATTAEINEILEKMRRENPDEPTWRGLESVDVTPESVDVVFHEAEDPALRRSGNVDVACHLY